MKKLFLCAALVFVYSMHANITNQEVRIEQTPSHGALPTVVRSALKTIRSHPLFSALALWALLHSRESISNHPIVSSLILSDLLSEFALHMLHNDVTQEYYDTI